MSGENIDLQGHLFSAIEMMRARWLLFPPMSSYCPCGEHLWKHCVNCGSCLGGECNESHIPSPKFGYAATPTESWPEIILDDALDAELVDSDE